MIGKKILQGVLTLLLIGGLFPRNVPANVENLATDSSRVDKTLETVIVAQPEGDDFGIPVYLADKLGYFEEEGLAVKFIQMKSVPLSMASLLGGNVQFCLTDYDQALKSFEMGKSLKIILTTTEKHPWSLMARPEILSVNDLKGKHIAADISDSGSKAFADKILLHFGLNPAKDVVFVDLPEAAILDAYSKGEVDATIAGGVRKAELLTQGAKVLTDMNDPVQHQEVLGNDSFPLKVILATDEYLQSNPEITQKFVYAVTRAMAWEAEHQSIEIADKVKDYPHGNLDERVIDDMRHAFSYTGSITEMGHKAVEKQSLEVGLISMPIPMEKVVDMSYWGKTLTRKMN